MKRIKQDITGEQKLTIDLNVSLYVDEQELQMLRDLIPLLFQEGSQFRMYATEHATRVFINDLIKQVQQVCPSVTTDSINSEHIGHNETRLG